MTFANRTARVLGPYYEGEVPLGSIQILRQPKDWVGGLKNCRFCRHSVLYLYCHNGWVRKSPKIC